MSKPKRGEPGYVSPLKGIGKPPEYMAWMRSKVRKRTLEERFWPKVEKTATCWLWKGATRHWGYGCIWHEGKILVAHRVSWEFTGQTIPDGMVLDHICKVPACVNPEHLRVVLPRENYVDYSNSPMAAHAKKTHCKMGHPFTPENTAVMYRPARVSKTTGRRVGKMTARICLTCRPWAWRLAVIPRERPPGSKWLPSDPDYHLRPKGYR